MKKFSYKKGKAVIRTLKEPKKQKKKLNLDRVLYFALLLLLIFWLGSFIYKKTVWIYGNGQMLMEKVDVNFTNDIRVKEIFINEGDTVFSNSKLFNYFQDDFDSDASIVLKNIDKKERYFTDYEDILREIKLKYVRLQHLKEQLKLLESQEKQTIKLILLDVYTKDKADELKVKKLALQGEIKLLKNEIYLLSLQKKHTSNKKNNDAIARGNQNFTNTYRSPIKGVIGQILKNSEEACYKAEKVMTIHDVEKVFIKAYFNLKDIAKVKKGSLVHVEFPDKTISKGIIKKLYIATYKAPTEFQKKYEPTERNILAEIIPIDKEEIPAWGKYYKLNLKVKINKI
ncbi:HlyD family efflux transporter periplasmic adaptor subunit [Tenacibaculum sp. 190524A02b]|uniref:HlyD family secretion protein n=1 Tax=Tenacibaculum vairaonense TaxID=3137860 RepID=A0ABM9PP32_9FLAO